MFFLKILKPIFLFFVLFYTIARAQHHQYVASGSSGSASLQAIHYQELVCGGLLGALAMLVGQTYLYATDKETDDIDEDELIDCALKKEKSSATLSYDQRLQFLYKGWSRFDITNIDVEAVTSMTSGFSYHQLARFLKIVVKHATQYNLDDLELQHVSAFSSMIFPVTMTMIRLALDEMHGGSLSNLTLDQEDRMHVALHEAGHALAIMHNKNYRLNFVSTISREKSGGRNVYARRYATTYETLKDCYDEIVICLCGGVAEQLFGFDKAWFTKHRWVYTAYHTRASVSSGLIDFLSRSSVKHDVVHARNVAMFMIEHKLIDITHVDRHNHLDLQVQVDAILEECYQQAVTFLQPRRNDLKKIANLVLTQDIIEGASVYALYD